MKLQKSIISSLAKISIYAFLAGFILVSCTTPAEKLANKEYARSIAIWDSLRLISLKSPNGWLNLRGLFWLNQGENTLGSGAGNNFIIARGPERIGNIFFENGKTVFVASENQPIQANGVPINKINLSENDEILPIKLTVDSLSFNLIKRGARFGIRLRDYLNPRINELHSIDRFPPDRSWIIDAKFIENTSGITISIPNVLGEVSVETIPGVLEFELQNRTYRLYPTGTKEKMFLVFADDTNALETYGTGRFLSIDGPDSLGVVQIDFNKAYNPPCAFSEFATCPLPPKENRLPFKVLAGEKSVHL